MTHSVTVIKGDGIGPEIMDATLSVLEATGVNFNFRFAEAGREVFKRGDVTGVPDETIESFRETKVGLKAPLATDGDSGRSANVNLRRRLDLYANIRPVSTIPGVTTPFGSVDLIVVRENSEDLYVGEERYISPGEVHSIKTTTDRAAEMISRVGFELARLQERSFVTCVAKRNILQLGDRLFSDAFDRVSTEYSGIRADYLHVDALAERLVINPKALGVMVMNNLFGDLISDLTAGLVGGLGVAPSGNFGKECAMFEAVHGTADGIAGQNKANPTALILSAEMMLRSLGQKDAADRLRNAVFALYERGEVRTQDKMIDGAKAVGTSQFADEIIGLMERGEAPSSKNAAFENYSLPDFSSINYEGPAHLKTLTPVGIDVEILSEKSPAAVYEHINRCLEKESLKLKCVASRGGVVPSDSADSPSMPTVYSVRLLMTPGRVFGPDFNSLKVFVAGIGRIVGFSVLNTSDGKRMYSLFQGEGESDVSK